MKTTWFFAALIIGGLSSFCLAYSGGDGTTGNPYQIADANDLLELAADTGNYDKSFILTADIDLQGVVMTPIGKTSAPFTGLLEGNNHDIVNFTYSSTTTSANIGLFGYIDHATIQNLYMGHVNVSSAGQNVGGLAGRSSNSTIRRCYTTGQVQGVGEIGGLVGWNTGGSITGCFSTCTVSGGMYVGGLVGDNAGDISDSCALGSVSGSYDIGGLAGFGGGHINYCYATGAVGNGAAAGGLTGTDGVGTVLFSFWNTETSGKTTSGGGTGKTTAQMKTLATFTDAEWDFTNETANGTHDTWRMCADGQNYPGPSWTYGSRGDFACPDGSDMQDLIVLAQNWLTSELVNPATFNYACDVDGDGLINQEDFNRLSQSWPGENFVQSSTVGECVENSNGSQAQTSGLFSESLRFNVTVQGQMILFEDVVNANCCKDEIQLKATVASGQILLKEQVKLGSMCMCNCNFPVEAEIGPFEPGQYTFTVIQSENNGSGQVIGEVFVVIE